MVVFLTSTMIPSHNSIVIIWKYPLTPLFNFTHVLILLECHAASSISQRNLRIRRFMSSRKASMIIPWKTMVSAIFLSHARRADHLFLHQEHVLSAKQWDLLIELLLAPPPCFSKVTDHSFCPKLVSVVSRLRSC